MGSQLTFEMAEGAGQEKAKKLLMRVHNLPFRCLDMEKESWKEFLTFTLGGVSSAAAEIDWVKQR